MRGSNHSKIRLLVFLVQNVEDAAKCLLVRGTLKKRTDAGAYRFGVHSKFMTKILPNTHGMALQG